MSSSGTSTGWPQDEGLIDWYRSTLRNLLDVFDASPADHECLTFLPAPTPLIMWARRQASEIAVHRYDAAHARGVGSHFEPAFAADMLAELLHGFAPRMRARHVTGEHVLRVVLTDVGDRYDVTMGPSGVRTHPPGASCDLTVSGTAADIYLLMWNRPAGPTIRLDGNRRVLNTWRETCRIEWL